MEREIYRPQNGPEAKGPYSPAVGYGNLIFVSGQGPVDPATGQIVRGDAVTELKVALNNVETILKAAGSRRENVLKVTLYLADMNDFAAVNAAYQDFFQRDFPARTTVQAGRLPLDIKVEVDVIAFRSNG